MTIRVLPPRLANQIAAGEVVERPASVVKELVENAIDAGASAIRIDIEQGGHRLLRIRDNGCGIPKDQLSLALARHATSKISDLDDLEAIVSFGFRGEALASISSVSRLTLTSRPADQSEAWLARAEGREMAVVIEPAAHPPGTTVEVRDLFFNTPARRRFLRTEKTEFDHIDEVCRRLGLAHQQLDLQWFHNGKLIRQLRPASDERALARRVGAVVGDSLLQRASRLNVRHQGLALHGWLLATVDCVPGAPQYAYVNGRAVRDKLIGHALRQAYGERLAAGQQPGYLLFLELDPREVDVNVHPAKHEVRFHQSRLIHDFIVAALTDALAVEPAPAQPSLPALAEGDDDSDDSGNGELPLAPSWQIQEAPPVATDYQPPRHGTSGRGHTYQPPSPPSAAARSAYLQLLDSSRSQTMAPSGAEERADEAADGPLLVQLRHGFLLAVVSGQLVALPMAPLWANWLRAGQGSRSQPLLMPMRLHLESGPSAELLAALAAAGIFIEADGGSHWTLRAVPQLLRHVDWARLLATMVANPGQWPELAAAAVPRDQWQQVKLEKIQSWLLVSPGWPKLSRPLPLDQWLMAQDHHDHS